MKFKFDVDAEFAAYERRQRGEPEPAPAAELSPIENALMAALEQLDAVGAGLVGATMERQAPIAGYFIDLLISTPGFRLAVECDGHEFHERTRQQATYDRARDRELLRLGVPTIRFTGSEIHRDANQCARELVDTWRSTVERWRKG